ncbi:MAG TPA: DUF29 domain-containing protein [Stellaceae bacterium]|nr:DUF29 domain-containing protein [Stellaceae bacterium]
MPKSGALYDEDFVRWTADQAAALRRAKSAGVNLPLDWDNLAEEIESLGRSNRRELRSQITRILHHLLKLEASPALEPQAGWRNTIQQSRDEIEALLEDSPSLRNEVDALIAKQIRAAAKLAARDLEAHGEPVGQIEERRAAGGFTADEVIGDWFPQREG